MSLEIKVPPLGESVTEATIAKWFKNQGDYVKADEILVELETDKVTLEVNAPANGIIKEQKFQEGDTVEVGAILGSLDESAEQPKESAETKPQPSSPAPVQATAIANQDTIASPAAQKIATENNVAINQVPTSGKDGRVTKGDVLSVLEGGSPEMLQVATKQGPREERVKMTKLRQKIAQRLKESQNTAAILTTFNEIDMTNVIALRNKYKEAFEKKHGIKLGFMSFFVKAAIAALKEIPEVNAEIQSDEIVYKNYYDIGVAVGTPQGLVVPVVRDADMLSFAGIEQTIAEYGKKARDGKLSINEMTGGSFTVSNGGVFGSLLSTPIINPPQTGILGMHKTQERPVAVNGNIEIRPMMYIALSYDHRIIDGREAVTFLVRVKENIEDPQRLLLDM